MTMQNLTHVKSVKNWFLEKNIWFYLLIFATLFIFFTQVHMLVPYDGDDWVCSAYMRLAVPQWKAWNPTKILPEELFPIAGYLAAYVVNPILHDYIFSIIVTTAILYSGLITIYIYMFSRLLTYFFNLEQYQNNFISLLFFLFHFLILKGKENTSDYLFGSINLTCIYHYSIPAYMNFVIVFYLWRKLPEYLAGKVGILEKSIFVLGLYLALFSNVEHSIITASFIGALVIGKYGKNLLNPAQWKHIIKSSPFFSGTIFIWLISLAFEASGGRARNIGRSLLELPFKETFRILFQALHFNSLFLITSGMILFVGIYYLYKEKMSSPQRECLRGVLKISVTAFLLTFVYLILVNAKASPDYIGRGDVLISILGWVLLMVSVFAAYVLKRNPKIFLAAPVIILIILSEVMNPRSPYKEAIIYNNASTKAAYALSCDFLQQIITADQAGADEMTLIVPVGNKTDNWPHPTYMGGNISYKLFKEGIISRQIKIKVQPDIRMNKKYQITVPK